MTTTATTVRERPILFSGEMVRAILAGRKTQTRRPIVPQPTQGADGTWVQQRRAVGHTNLRRRDTVVNGVVAESVEYHMPVEEWLLERSGAKVGDLLWVREAWSTDHAAFYPNFPIVYRADNPVEAENGRAYSPEAKRRFPFKWRPSIHMKRTHSRLTLEITEVRVQRLQEISEEDAEAEGVDNIPSAPASLTHYGSFGKLWDILYAKRGFGWQANPWVWAISFKAITPPSPR